MGDILGMAGIVLLSATVVAIVTVTPPSNLNCTYTAHVKEREGLVGVAY